MSRRDKYNRSGYLDMTAYLAIRNIPQHAIEAIARCIWPDIQASFNSEEGQRMFAEWKAQQEAEKQAASVKGH